MFIHWILTLWPNQCIVILTSDFFSFWLKHDFNVKKNFRSEKAGVRSFRKSRRLLERCEKKWFSILLTSANNKTAHILCLAKPQKFDKIYELFLNLVSNVKKKVWKFHQNFVAFSEYMNFSPIWCNCWLIFFLAFPADF